MDLILRYYIKNYTLISKEKLSQQEYEKYKKKYSEIENQELYILKNDVKKEKLENLNKIIEKPILAVSLLENEEFTLELNKKKDN